MREKIIKDIQESIAVKNALAVLPMVLLIEEAVGIILGTVQRKGKILLFGNGGSAADSQHMAAELVGRYKKERAGICAIALTTDTSILTAVGNDYGYDKIFERQVEALGCPGDVAIGISTSGNSKNVLLGIAKAKAVGMSTLGLTGQDGGQMKHRVDLNIAVPSQNTPRVQEAHILIGHIICERLDEML